MWNDLAQKFFRMHETDLRKRFHQQWAGTDNKMGRFEKEIKKLEKNFKRKCSSKNLIPGPFQTDKVSRDSVDSYDEFVQEIFPENKPKQSFGQLRVENNPGHRMRHIVRNVEKWAEDYLTGCSNQKIVIARWKRFVDRWENEMAKNPIFEEEFKKEEMYLKQTRTNPGRPCGRIYSEFGLHGQSMELFDASVDDEFFPLPDCVPDCARPCNYDANGKCDMYITAFGTNNLMSMIPYPGTRTKSHTIYL